MTSSITTPTTRCLPARTTLSLAWMRPLLDRGRIRRPRIRRATAALGIDAGRPPLEPPKRKSDPLLSPVVVDAIGQALATERKTMRAHVQKRFEEFADLIGAEVGKAEKEMRREMDALKLELAELRGFQRAVASSSDDSALPKFLRDRHDAAH
jgi:hypothetical protein